MYQNEQLYNRILAQTGADEVRLGGKLQAAVSCPYCPTVSDYQNPRCTVGNFMDEAYGGWAFHCFVCDATVSMIEFSLMIGVEPSFDDSPLENVRREPTRRQAEYTWPGRTDELVRRYTENKQRYQKWDAYKHLTKDAIDTWSLGYGKLPETKFNEDRLITPIHDPDGNVQWIRGRLPQGQEGTKWVGAGGVKPTQIHLSQGWLIAKGMPLVICENYVDALIINFYLGDKFRAVPTFSVSYWSEAWVKTIVERKPSQVLVAFDPDLAGNGPVNKQHARQLFTERIAKVKKIPQEDVVIKRLQKLDQKHHIAKRWVVTYETPEGVEKLNLNEPFGMQRRKQLLQAGVPAKLCRWTEPDSDVGDFLSQELAKLKD